MTLAEAQKVATLLAEAHGGCGSCAGDLVDRARQAFPEFEWATTNEMPAVQGRDDWEAINADWDAEWPAGSENDYGEPCQVRVRLRP